MRAKTSKGVLHFEFRHESPVIQNPGKLRSTKGANGIPLTKGRFFMNQEDAGTYCVIKRDDHEGIVISQGKSTLHPLDAFNFNKEKGRKVAFRLALVKMALSKEDRQTMWDCYHNRGVILEGSVEELDENN